jgi:hypothetical protein
MQGRAFLLAHLGSRSPRLLHRQRGKSRERTTHLVGHGEHLIRSAVVIRIG